MDAWTIWLIVMGLLLIIELLSQMMWALCLAVGCLGGLVGSLLGISVPWQVLILALLSIVAYILLVPLFQKWHALSVDKKGREARTGMDALLGRTAIVSEEITPGRPGRVRIDGDNWQVVADSPSDTVRRGTEVVVTGYDSIILKVRPSRGDE